MIKTVKINKQVSIGPGQPLALIGGPCVIEEEKQLFHIARELKKICQELGISYIFKTSYDKANRSSIDSYRGPGLEASREMLAELKQELQVPVLLDIHHPEQAEIAAEIADILQIPAFLCRQTDLLVSAGKTGRVVNIKKGQFLAPQDIIQNVRKVESTGNSGILLTERGTSFGYNNLVVDMRTFDLMKESGYPVIFDATHSVQLPGASGGVTSGQREFIPLLARAAVAAGANALFMEIHPEPEKAKCDASNQFPLEKIKGFLSQIKNIYEVVNND